MKALNLLILLIFSSLLIGQTNPLLNNEFSALTRPLVLSAAMDNRDNIVMTGSGGSSSQIQMTKPNGEVSWSLTVNQDVSYGAVYATVLNDHIYASYADSLRKISSSGVILKTVPLPQTGWAKLLAHDGQLVVLPVGNSVAIQNVYRYDDNLNLINAIDSAYVGQVFGSSGGDNNQLYLATLRQDIGGVHTNSTVEFLRYNGQELVWRTQLPDKMGPQIIISDGRIFFAATDHLPYNGGGLKLGWTYGELDYNSGAVLWQNTWLVPWYPSSVPADAWVEGMSVNQLGGFIINGSATKPGLDSLNFDRNHRWPVSISFNDNGDSLWSVMVQRRGSIKGSLWGKNHHLFLWGQVGGEGIVQVYSVPGVTSVEQIDETPKSFSLAQNYPNPFNPSTTIRFSIPVENTVTLKVYDIIGREVATLVDEFLGAGTHEVEFAGQNLASGTYFYSLTSGNKREVKKMVLLK